MFRSNHILTVIAAAAFFLVANPVLAQSMYKCTGPGGSTSFSDKPCSDSRAVQSVQKNSHSNATSLDVSSVCKDVNRNDPTKGAICRDMEMCEKTGDPDRCEVYCLDTIHSSDMPGSGLEFGPTSKLCLSKNKRIRGANWVEVSGRHFQQPTKETYVPYKCLDPIGKLASDRKGLFCNSELTRCQDDSIKQKQPELVPIDAVASKICQSANR